MCSYFSLFELLLHLLQYAYHYIRDTIPKESTMPLIISEWSNSFTCKFLWEIRPRATTDAPCVRINDDSRLMISNLGNFSMADANRPAANVIILSFKSMIRKLGFWTKAFARASIPGGRMPFCGTRMTSSVPIIYWRKFSLKNSFTIYLRSLRRLSPMLVLLHSQDDFDRQWTVSIEIFFLLP